MSSYPNCGNGDCDFPTDCEEAGRCLRVITTTGTPVIPVLVPINMILFCPSCGYQHIDATTAGWPNPPHRSHLCHKCNEVWRPADVPTNGVAEIATRGKNDTKTGRQRGWARFISTETNRCVEVVRQMFPAEGPRMTAAKINLIYAIQQRK